jgi:formylmethanofuran dehydrogenase subunit E
MELSLTLAEHLNRLTILHPTLCPRQVLGVQMARLACNLLNVDPAIERKSIYVYMEIGRCAADAVMIVTGASPMNQLMQLMDYGKVAATFVNRQTGAAMRINERHDIRDIAVAMMLPHLTAWEAQRDAYQVMTYDQLFDWQHVTLRQPLPTISEKYSVKCDSCGDRINEHRDMIVQGRTLCRVCAFGGYYVTAEMVLEDSKY